MKSILIKVLTIACIFTSCQKDDYKADGGVSSPNVHMTTYDFLKSHGKFDSLVRIIDHAGIKDIVNANVTLFATTDYGIRDYVSAKKQEKIVQVGDENISFSITDIPAKELRDSMMIYLFDGKINRDNLTTEDKFFESKFGNIPDVRFNIKLRRTRDYSSYLNYVDYLNFTKVIKSLDADEPDYNAIPNEEIDRSFDCQTSGLISTTGVIHVLDNSHRLFFNRGKMAQ